MIENIKKFLNWPTKGISNLGDLNAYFKANWLSLLILFIIGLVILWILKKVLGLVFGMFKD